MYTSCRQRADNHNSITHGTSIYIVINGHEISMVETHQTTLAVIKSRWLVNGVIGGSPSIRFTIMILEKHMSMLDIQLANGWRRDNTWPSVHKQSWTKRGYVRKEKQSNQFICLNSRKIQFFIFTIHNDDCAGYTCRLFSHQITMFIEHGACPTITDDTDVMSRQATRSNAHDEDIWTVSNLDKEELNSIINSARYTDWR